MFLSPSKLEDRVASAVFDKLASTVQDGTCLLELVINVSASEDHPNFSPAVTLQSIVKRAYNRRNRVLF